MILLVLLVFFLVRKDIIELRGKLESKFSIVKEKKAKSKRFLSMKDNIRKDDTLIEELYDEYFREG